MARIRITLETLTPPMHAVADFRAHNQATAQRGAVHGDGFAFGKLDAVAVLDQILGLALADFAHLADRALEEVALIPTIAAAGGVMTFVWQ